MDAERYAVSEGDSVKPDNLTALKTELENELQRLLHFWGTKAVDSEHGGFLGRINYVGEKYDKAPKGAILNARILWTFSAAYRTTRNESYKKMADRSFQYLNNYFLDTANGGVFWELDYRGNPINQRKQAYAQSFAIYAFAEYSRAVNNAESLNRAKAWYQILENKFWDNQHAGYIEAMTENWRPIDDMRLSEKDLNATKSMNTHLHILEAYSNLYRAWPNEKLKKSIIRLIDIFQHQIIDKRTGHFNLFFDMDWQVKSTAISFGHNIEGAWLLHEAAELIGDQEYIDKVRKTAINLVDVTLRKGLDTDGSLFNELHEAKYDKDKHWWPQAEAMVGLMDAYKIEPRETYLTGIYKLWHFIKTHLMDKVNGEWFWRVDANGKINPTDDKVGFWKCPYHNTRALMEVIRRINSLT